MEIKAQIGNSVIMIAHQRDGTEFLSHRIFWLTDCREATAGETLSVDLWRPKNCIAPAIDETLPCDLGTEMNTQHDAEPQHHNQSSMMTFIVFDLEFHR